MTITPSDKFLERSKKLFKKHPELREKVKFKLVTLQITPTHPGLELHKLIGKLNDVWAITIERNIRLAFLYVSEGILLISIGTHDEIYRDLL